jgi:hypothetical protein
MHTGRRIALSIAACLAMCVARAEPQVQLLERESILFGTRASRPVPLTVVQLEGSGWTKERAIHAVREAAAILAQCDVGVRHVEWVRLAVPPQYLDFFVPLSRELARAHPVQRPAIYLVRDTRNRPAFEAEAIGRGNSRTRPELADTVWMIAGARDPGIALAHELAHVLMNSGEHSDEPGNLMGEQTALQNTALSPAQCKRIRETAAANGLLSP